jgi:tether containing UBX domain for GLUT4
MGRELSSFRDMQMTLRDLGFNDGNTLLRLSFKMTEVPLEEAMLEISQYFKDLESTGSGSVSPTDAVGSSSTANIAGTQNHSEEIKVPDAQAEELFYGEPSTTGLTGEKITNPEEPDISANESVADPEKRLISVYAPPNNSTPQAATCETHPYLRNRAPVSHSFLILDTFNAADYEPTIDQVRAHQAHLTSTAQNRRLLSDAELATKQRAAEERLAKLTDIEIKIRYPDQMQLVSRFTSIDTAASLYGFVKSTLRYMDEPFSLSYTSSKGPKTVPRDDTLKLIKDLGFEGRMLVTVTWDGDASTRARSAGNLKDEYAKMAKEIKFQEIQAVQVAQEQERREGKGKERATGEGKKEGFRPKWLKFPGKK